MSSFHLGSLQLPHPIIYSPLAGCSDFPFRQMARRYHTGLIYCEMVKMQPLLRGISKTYDLLDYSPDMHPIGGQIVGNELELAGPAARCIESLGFDTVDLNCGCPVDKVTKDGSGSGLLKTPAKIGDLISNMVAAVAIPVTVKIRAGWDRPDQAAEITQIAEQAGAAMISIHGRTRSQGYKGKANRQVIREAKQAAATILVAGNGDIFDPFSAEHMFTTTGCDAILVSRGTMGAPWIGQQIIDFFCDRPIKERSTEERLQVLLDHLDCIEQYKNPKRAALDVRRVGPWYCKRGHKISELRTLLAKTRSISEAKERIYDYLEVFNGRSIKNLLQI